MPNWIIAIIVAAIIAAAGLWAHNAWENHKTGLRAEGYTQCTSDIALATAEAEKATKVKQTTEKKATKKRKETIYEKNDDRPSGSLLNRYYDGLRQEQRTH